MHTYIYTHIHTSSDIRWVGESKEKYDGQSLFSIPTFHMNREELGHLLVG